MFASRLGRLALAVAAILSFGVASGAAQAAPGTAPAAPSMPGAAPGDHTCDPIDPAACLLPFPNDWFTVPDAGTATGRRVDLSVAGMPRNWLGAPIQPAEWNRNDGFSPGSMLLAHVPGIDLARTGAAPITDIGSSLRTDAPIVIVDTETGRRWPYWAELDANATDPARQALIVRPARNLLEGHRYAVALRDLRDASGALIRPGDAFARILGHTVQRDDPLYARQRAERRVLTDLARAGVHREGLYLAWDFTVASERNLSERILHMRDEAQSALGPASPGFTVTDVTDLAADQPIAREVRGFVSVPSYLDAPGGPPGSALHYGTDGLPEPLPGNTQLAPFRCEIPRAAFSSPGHPSLYGHGLLGSENEVGAGNVKAMAAEHDFVFCATKWIGMSNEDVGNAVNALLDLSGFRSIADRLQQSLLDTMFLGRAMLRGFTSNAAFQTADGRPLIDTGAGLAYDGNSQGGILGGAFMATSTDVRRGVLGVPAMNYSTLLNRSVDFSRFQAVLDISYPDKLTQQIDLALLQMLWDRADADGYALHMTDHPLPGTPRHRVLMHVAFGDHQVANVASEVEARTIGARIHVPAIAPGRNPDVVPYWGIRPIRSYPFGGSAIIIWDSGSPPPPLTNTPPTEGHDPHGDPRNSALARQQKAVFLTTGEVIDVCGGAPCTAAPAG